MAKFGQTDVISIPTAESVVDERFHSSTVVTAPEELGLLVMELLGFHELTPDQYGIARAIVISSMAPMDLVNCQAAQEQKRAGHAI